MTWCESDTAVAASSESTDSSANAGYSLVAAHPERAVDPEAVAELRACGLLDGQVTAGRGRSESLLRQGACSCETGRVIGKGRGAGRVSLNQ
jgi:hypothetical protein